MHLEFVGGAQTVTGSKHILRTANATVLLECGLFQGRRRESIERNRTLGVDVRELDAVVLSHAHIDHSGALPILVKNGYTGPIYATPATRDLCAALLADAAMIQASDARYINKVIERDNADMDFVEPLFDETDVLGVLRQMISVPYRRAQLIAPGITLTFNEAGHILGSAIPILDIDEHGRKRRLAFTGDLGRKHAPILRPPEPPKGVHVLLSESTYGDRTHGSIEQMEGDLATIINRAVARGGKIVIPSFALERAQEVIYALKRLRGGNHIPSIPVFVDSPLTVTVTEIFKLHPECYDREMREMLVRGDSPFDFADLEYISDKEVSKSVTASTDSSIVISASGMCEAGRILHHLKGTIEDEKNSIVIVGFQAPHTLGRRIAERHQRVKIFGVERNLRAEVNVLDGFSAHADQTELLEFAAEVSAESELEKIVLVHGELPAQKVLAAKLDQHGFDVAIPKAKDRIEF